MEFFPVWQHIVHHCRPMCIETQLTALSYLRNMLLSLGGMRQCSSHACVKASEGMPCPQCKVLYVGKYLNPSFGPLGEHLRRHARGAEIWPSGPPKHPQFLPRGPIV